MALILPRILTILTVLPAGYDKMKAYLYSTLNFVKLSLFYPNYFVYHYECHLPPGHWWKPPLSWVYVYWKMLWSQVSHNGACGFRISSLFEMLSVVFISVSLGVLVLLQPGDQVGSNTWIPLKSYHSSVFVQSQSWSGQQVSGKNNTPCAIIENELKLTSNCFVIRGLLKYLVAIYVMQNWL